MVVVEVEFAEVAAVVVALAAVAAVRPSVDQPLALEGD